MIFFWVHCINSLNVAFKGNIPACGGLKSLAPPPVKKSHICQTAPKFMKICVNFSVGDRKKIKCEQSKKKQKLKKGYLSIKTGVMKPSRKWSTKRWYDSTRPNKIHRNSTSICSTKKIEYCVTWNGTKSWLGVRKKGGHSNYHYSTAIYAMIILRVWIYIYFTWTFHFYNFFSFCLFPTDLHKFPKKYFFLHGENFQKIIKFCHFFFFFQTICLNSCKLYLKHAQKSFFWNFLAIFGNNMENFPERCNTTT